MKAAENLYKQYQDRWFKRCLRKFFQCFFLISTEKNIKNNPPATLNLLSDITFSYLLLYQLKNQITKNNIQLFF